MNNLLLPFKYSCLNLSPFYQENKLKQLGWKLRRYQNWEDVYSHADDKKVMIDFANQAIEEKTLAEEYLSNIHGILLNVKRWSMDKENIEGMEPEHQKDWDFANTRLMAIKQNPSVAIKILKEVYPGEDQMFTDVGISYGIARFLIAKLVSGTLKSIDTYSKEEYFESEHDDFICMIFGENANILEAKLLRRASSIFECCEMLGLPDIENIEYPDFQQVELQAREVVFTAQGLSKDKFLEVIKTGKIVNVKLNENHKYFKMIKATGHYPELERFLKAYALASIDMPASQFEILEDFGFYLSKRLEDV